jgi:hypothetical protein
MWNKFFMICLLSFSMLIFTTQEIEGSYLERVLQS